MSSEFTDKVVLVTGATGNLGSAVSRRFLAAGAKVVVAGRSTDEITTFANELGGGDNVFPVVAADLGSPADVDVLVKQIEDHYGRIDILAHTVGGYAAGKPVHEDVQVDGMAQWEKNLALNARPVYVTAGRVARHMIEHEIAGHMVIILARAALKGTANNGAYNASKAFALRIVESMSAELRDKGIHINGILPGTIDTPANRRDTPNADTSKWVTVDQLVDAVTYLSSEQASAIYGIGLEVYGRS